MANVWRPDFVPAQIELGAVEGTSGAAARLGQTAGGQHQGLRHKKETTTMARRYSRSASKDVESAMRRRGKGMLKSGRSGKTVKSRKQAIAIGLSEARKKGKKVPRKRKAS
jgi:hypothetical protein